MAMSLASRRHKSCDPTQSSVDIHNISSSSEFVDDVELADLCFETDEEESHQRLLTFLPKVSKRCKEIFVAKKPLKLGL